MSKPHTIQLHEDILQISKQPKQNNTVQGKANQILLSYFQIMSQPVFDIIITLLILCHKFPKHEIKPV